MVDKWQREENISSRFFILAVLQIYCGKKGDLS